jgi:hypothetical protein
MTIAQTGSAGNGTITCTNEGSLTLAAIAAAVLGMTQTGTHSFHCDRRLNLVNSTLTMQDESLVHDFNVGILDVGFRVDEASTFNCYDSSIRWNPSGLPAFHQIIGLDTDTNHGSLDWQRSWFWLGDGTVGIFIRAYRGTTVNNIADCQFIGQSSFGAGRIGGASSVYERNRHYKGAALSQFLAISFYTNVEVDNSDYGYVWNTLVSGNNTIREAVYRNLTTGSITVSPRVAGTRTLQVIDLQSNLGRSANCDGGSTGQIGLIQWIYTYNATVINETDSLPEQNVRLCIFRDAGTLLQNKVTDVSGLVTESNIVHSETTCQRGLTSTSSFGPFKIRYGKYGFLLNERILNVDEPLVDAIRLIKDTSVVANEATALAYSGISINWGAGSIDVTGTRSMQEFHDYLTAQFFASANFSDNDNNKPSTLTSAGVEVSFTLNITGTLTDTLALIPPTGSNLDGSISCPVTLNSVSATCDDIDNLTDVLSINGTSTFEIDGVGGGTFPLGSAGASAVIEVSAANSNDTFDATAFTFNASTTFENSSGQPIIVQLSAGQQQPTKLETSGTITFVEPSKNISLTNLIANSRIQIYNVTTDTEIINTVKATTTYTNTYDEGVGFTAGDTVRIRVTNVQGVTGYEPYQTTILAASTGFAAIIDQQADDVYNSFALDGSAVTKFSADYVDNEVDVVVGSNFTLQELYSWWAYNLYTSQGISDFFGGLVAENEANFRIVNSLIDINLDNTTVTNLYQTDNRRIYRDDGNRPVKDPTTGGGGVDVEWRSPVTIANIEGLPQLLADAVWDEPIADHLTAGSTGEALDGAGSGGGGGGGTDWSAAERAQIRDALGIDGSKTTALGGQLQLVATKANVDAVEAAILAAIAGLNDVDAQAVAQEVWDYLQSETTVSNSMKEAVEKILINANLIPATI